MAKKGMARPDKTKLHPKNEAYVPELQGKAKTGKKKANPIIAGTMGAQLKVWHEKPISDAHGGQSGRESSLCRPAGFAVGKADMQERSTALLYFASCRIFRFCQASTFFTVAMQKLENPAQKPEKFPAVLKIAGRWTIVVAQCVKRCEKIG